MWLCLNNAFLSVVHKQCAKDELLVRARVAGHIEAVFPDAVVTESPGTDYYFRAKVKRGEVAAALTQMALGINYNNFKNSVIDDDLHDHYSAVWGIMSKMQEVPPYSGRHPGRSDLFSDDDVVTS